jgi:hypothetical protein
MKKRNTVFILSALLCGTAVLGQSFANQEYIYTFNYNGKIYEVIKEMKTWENSSLCAVEQGGYLIEIDDETEEAAVFDTMINEAGVSPAYTASPDGGGISYTWIGATDRQTKETWV